MELINCPDCGETGLQLYVGRGYAFGVSCRRCGGTTKIPLLGKNEYFTHATEQGCKICRVCGETGSYFLGGYQARSKATECGKCYDNAVAARDEQKRQQKASQMFHYGPNGEYAEYIPNWINRTIRPRSPEREESRKLTIPRIRHGVAIIDTYGGYHDTIDLWFGLLANVEGTGVIKGQKSTVYTVNIREYNAWIEQNPQPNLGSSN